MKQLVGILLGCFCGIVMAQDAMSKGSFLYLEGDYKGAIAAYTAELREKPLQNLEQQRLATALYKTKDFPESYRLFKQLYSRDTVANPTYINTMLQAMVKVKGAASVEAFIRSASCDLPKVVIERAVAHYNLKPKEVFEDVVIINAPFNSPKDDFSPTFYKDKILLTSGRDVSGYLKLFEANNDGSFTRTGLFDGVPYYNFHQATPFYAAGLQTLFFIQSNANEEGLIFDENGKNTLALVSLNAAGSFEYILRDVSTSFYYPFYDESTNRLYFAADFYDSYGGTDLYYVNTNQGRIMSAPINLGPGINTAGNEIAPYIFGGNLYFSSDVFYGKGGMDMYKSVRTKKGLFNSPIPLGGGLNSAADDFGFALRQTAVGEIEGYFSSNRSGGMGMDDLYVFKMQAPADLVTLPIHGVVSKGVSALQTISGASVVVMSNRETVLAETVTDERGLFEVNIPSVSSGVTMVVTKPLFAAEETYISGTALKEAKQIRVGLTGMDQVVANKNGLTSIKTPSLVFEKGKSEITPELSNSLLRVAEVLKQFPEFQIRIESHTDSRGGATANFNLSQQRAEAIKAFLIQQNIPSSQLVYVIGYGESQLLNNCGNGVYCPEVLHNVNERNELVIINYNLFEE